MKGKVTRPALRYHGGKWLLAPWIISLMPPHRVYVEPFAGGANVLLQKPRVAAEVYNDLDGQVVNVFRVLQDPEKAERLARRITLTPYARAEFDRTYTIPSDDVEAAAFTIIRSFMGHGTDSITRKHRTGFRAKMSDRRAMPAVAWAGWPETIPAFVDRLRCVVIENRKAVEVIERLDTPGTLFYVDPPYVTSTRSSLSDGRGASHGYRHEMTNDEHVELAHVLRSVDGMVMLSGYDCELYSKLYGDWLRMERTTLADGARPRVESLWLNPAAESRIRKPALPFAEVLA